MHLIEQFVTLPLFELRKRLQSGALRSRDLVESCIENEQTSGALLSAYHCRNDKQFRAQADTADAHLRDGKYHSLTGIPVSLKSVFGVGGFQCYAGTRFPMPPRWQREGTLVKRLHDQLVPVSGLTHASELAFGGLGINPHWGTPRNPWDAVNHRVPGGSSSGAALSVIGGSAVFALGSDTGGSVRVPAAAAGLVGLKPGKSRWPCDGIVPLSPKFDTIGVITRSVADAVDVFLAIEGRESAPQSLSSNVTFADFRVRLADDSCLAGLTPDLLEIHESAIGELRKAGTRVYDSDNRLFEVSIEILNQGPNTAAIECSSFIELEIPDWRGKLGERTNMLITQAEAVSAKHYLTRLQRLLDLQAVATNLMHETDILVSPTLCITTPTLKDIDSVESFSRASSRVC